jgi:hypothetical protein
MAETYTGTEGAAALAAGLDVMDGGERWAADGPAAINKTRDMIANRVQPIAKGGTGATSAAAARSALGAASANHTHTASQVTTASGITVQASLQEAHDIANLADENAGTGIMLARTAMDGGFFNPVWDRQVTANYRAAYISRYDNNDIRLGHTVSSERFKENIAPHDITDEQLAALQLVSFQWREEVDPSRHFEVGLIAERVAEAGIDFAVYRGEDGQVEGLAYERLWLALLPVVQRQQVALDLLAQRLDALAQRLDARDEDGGE